MAVAGVPVERPAFHPGNSLSGMTCLHAMEHPEKNHKEDNLFMLRKYIEKLTFIILIALIAAPALGQELVVYSARNEHLIKPVVDAYTKETGIKVKYLTGKAPALLLRLKAEGPGTPADLLITVDAGNLWYAARENVLLPLNSDVLQKNIPAHLRDPQNRWFGLSVRARTIVYNTKTVNPSELSSYEDLADPQWKGRLILRTSKKVYNQSLVAMLIAEHGEAATETIVRGWVKNLSVAPFSNDTKVMQAIAAGQGDVGIVNTYYYGRLIKKDPNLPLALFWPNQQSGGVHVNVSGGGVTRYSKHPDQARLFLEWLSSPRAQNLFADVNMEYPVNPSVSANPTVKSWGSFKENRINLTKAGELQPAAIRLMDRVGYK
jgi:iron(III) transport system substrate-binding protein